MTGPSRPWESLPPWKARLLEKVQNRSVDHSRVLRRGYPTYNLAHGKDDMPIRVWQAHLRELGAERGDAVIRARGSGIPEPMVAQARALGEHGIRWNQRQPPPPEPARGGDAAREAMIDSVASDVWQLEHMAAVTAAHRQRLAGRGIHSEAEPVAASQIHANMSALWVRAADTSYAADLTDAERAQLWGRDEQGWRTLVEATVDIYGDGVLEQQWRSHAWPGIEYEAQNGMYHLGGGEPVNTVDPGQLPPAPQVMIGNAQHALDAARADDLDTAGQRSEKAIAAARLDELSHPSWGSEPVGEPTITPPGLTPGLEPEL